MSFGGQLIRESVGSPVQKSCAEKFTNGRSSKVKVVVPKSPGFECELVASLKICWMEKTFLYVFTLGIFFELEGVLGM
jgi:hypothetical protein